MTDTNGKMWIDCWSCEDGYHYDCWDGCCCDAESGCGYCAQPCEICRGKGGYYVSPKHVQNEAAG